VRAATASVDGASRWQVLCDGREIMRKLRELFGSLIESIAKRICSLVLVTSVAIVPATSTPVGATPIKQFLANLNGGQVAPPKDVFSFAVAHLFFEEESAMLCFSITYSNLSSFETAVHRPRPSASGRSFEESTSCCATSPASSRVRPRATGPLGHSGAVAAHPGRAPIATGAARVAFWGAAAMGCTAVVGPLFGTAI
jgi:hypothetical protein